MAAIGRLGLVCAVMGAIPLLLLLRAVRWNVMGYPRAFREWQMLFLCRGCGQIFRAPEGYEAGLLRQK